MEDNLESEWVSVRPRVFDEKERHKFIFIVAWNDIEGKFAITCHNRTVQRRSTVLLEPFMDLPAPGTSVAEKHTKSKKDEACQAGKVRPHTLPKTKTVIGDKNALKPVCSKTECVSPTLGSWDIVTPKVIDIEILDPVDVPLSPDDADLGDCESSGREDFSWAGLFSFQDLRATHLQLTAVNSDLEPCLPSFPEEQSGVWSVIFGVPGVSQRETDALCYQLQVYLGHALDTCGWKILSEVLDKHKALDSMVELLQVYPEEDEAYGELLEATTQLYHYLLQPFRDMRELAMLRRQQIKISLETERLGPRRLEGLRREDEEWQKKAHAAVLSIQDLTVKFFETTTRAQKALFERMRADQKKFGKSAWAAAVERMERLQYAVSKETLQLMRAKEICLEQRKHGLKEEMQSLQEGEDAMLRVDQLEALYYELQLQLYDIGAEVLRCEELLLNSQLQSLRRQMTERQDEVVYYDAFESPDAMKGEDDHTIPPSPLRDEELSVLQQRTRQLEARRGRITTKKVYLKNKKEICIVNHNQKIQQRGSHDDSPQTLQHGGKAEEDEARSNARVSQDRQRTLDRLRSLKLVTLKSSRLHQFQPPSRRRGGRRPALTQPASRRTAPISPTLRPSFPRPLQLRQRLSTHSSTGEPRHASLPLAATFSSSPTPPSSSNSPSEEQQQGEGREKPPSPVRRHERQSESLPLAPFSPRFFDSSQLQTARKKLKKTSSLDSTQWRGRRSCGCWAPTRTTTAPHPGPDPAGRPAEEGSGPARAAAQAKSYTHSADALTRSIHEALRRIKEASPESESESEDEGLPCTDWEI
ncbi:hypothetical protein F7725_015780 [Dissostichus mawsoni]|uniref:Junction mediating and regulatory protein, p53 cofactor n=1 Tax=Dissostichus mawsoni TaxID=36200 RepID=A0A7J5YJD8_DISMA|nr:hypothetical protein F7725_015780 [Dissostichus mawsoni]